MARLEFVNKELLIARDVTVDYDQSAEAVASALKESVKIPDWCKYEEESFEDFPPERWNYGRTGVLRNVSVPIYAPRKDITTTQVREFLKEDELGIGTPADLASIGALGVMPLIDQGISKTVAVCPSDYIIPGERLKHRYVCLSTWPMTSSFPFVFVLVFPYLGHPGYFGLTLTDKSTDKWGGDGDYVDANYNPAPSFYAFIGTPSYDL